MILMTGDIFILPELQNMYLSFSAIAFNFCIVSTFFFILAIFICFSVIILIRDRFCVLTRLSFYWLSVTTSSRDIMV